MIVANQTTIHSSENCMSISVSNNNNNNNILYLDTVFPEKKLCSRVFTAVHSLDIQNKNIINDNKR